MWLCGHCSGRRKGYIIYQCDLLHCRVLLWVSVQSLLQFLKPTLVCSEQNKSRCDTCDDLCCVLIVWICIMQLISKIWTFLYDRLRQDSVLMPLIYQLYTEVMRVYVRKWCKCSTDVALRSIVDWGYYRQRLSSTIQKIITIPAALQKVHWRSTLD